MIILPRRPIDADAMSYARAGIPLHDVAHQLMDKAETWRPYAGAVIRHAIPTPELRDLQELTEYEHFEAVCNASPVEPVNQAMHERWNADPRSKTIRMGKLSFYALFSHNGIHPHVDQSIGEHNGGVPLSAPLVLLLAIEGITEYGLRPSGQSPFDPKYQELYMGQKRRPRPSTMDYVTLKPGDALLVPTLSPVIHISKALTKKRLVAGYATSLSLQQAA